MKKTIAWWIRSSSQLRVSNKRRVHDVTFKINAGAFNWENTVIWRSSLIFKKPSEIVMKGSVGVVVTLKSKMAPSSTSSGRNCKSTAELELDPKASKSPEPLPRRFSHISTHVSITATLISHFGEWRRHIGFFGNYNSYNARSSCKSIVWRNYE